MKCDSKLTKSELLEELLYLRSKLTRIEGEQEIFSNGPVVAFKWRNSDGWPVESVTSNVQQLLGYCKDDFLNGELLFEEIIAKPDLGRVAEEVKRACKRNLNAFDHQPYRVINKDGEQIWLHDHTLILRDSENVITHFYGYVFDISRQENINRIASNVDSISKSIIDSTSSVIYAKDLQGKIIFTNRKFEENLGLKQNEIIGKSDFDLFPEESANRFRQSDDLVKQLKKKIELRDTVSNTTGTIDIYATQKLPIFDEHKELIAIAGISTFVNSAVTFNQSSKESEFSRKLRDRKSHVGKWEIDLISRKIFWNKEGALAKRDQATVIFMTIDQYIDAIHPDDQENVRVMIERSMNPQILAPYQLKYRIIAKNGEVNYFESSGKVICNDAGVPIRILGETRNVTEIRMLEENLYASQKQLEETQVLGKLGNWSFEYPGDHLYWSAEIYRIFETTRDLFGSSYEAYLGLVHPDDKEMLHTALIKSIRQKSPIDIVHRIAMPDGDVKHIHVTGSTQYGKNGSYTSIGTIQDITLFKRSEIALQRAYSTLDLSKSSRARTLDALSIQIAEGVEKQKRAQTELAHRAELLKVISYISQEFINSKNWGEVIASTLQKLGVITGSSRTYLIKGAIGSKGNIHELRYEWCENGIKPFLNKTGNQPDPLYGEALFQLFKRVSNSKIYSNCESKYSDEERDIFEDRACKSFLMAPIFVNDELWGIIGFDNCTVEYRWPKSEINSVQTITGLLGSALARQLAIQEVIQKEQTINSIFRSSPMGIGLIKERVFQEVNDTFCSLVGYSKDELIGRNSVMIYPSRQEYSRVGLIKYDKIKADGIGTIETELLTKDGEVRNVLLSSSPVDRNDSSKGVVFSALDITDSKRAEKKIESERLHFASLLKHVPSIICIKDARGNWLEANDALLNLFSLRHVNYQGKSTQDLVPFASQHLQKALIECFSKSMIAADTGEEVRFELEISTPDDSSMMFKVIELPTFHSDGEIEALITIGYDITDQKAHEERRLKSLSEHKDALVREVHHRIKNHLQGIINLIRLNKTESSQDNNYLSEITNQIQSISLVYGLQSESAKSTVSFPKILKAILKNNRDLSQIPLSFTQNLKPGEYNITGEKTVPVSLIVNELVMNSIKHSVRKNRKSKIAVKLSDQNDVFKLTISNPGQLPVDFDFDSGLGCGNGLELVRAMTPSQGLTISLKQIKKRVVSEVRFSAPILIIEKDLLKLNHERKDA